MKQLTRKKITLFICSFLLLFGGMYLIDKIPFGIRWNRSPSLPYKLFACGPLKQLKRQDYISFYHPTSRCPLAKQIIGISGDRIDLRGDHIFVNDYDCGKAFNKTSSGLPLTPLDEEQILDGYLFVHAPHPDSFDSRYEQFGLIKCDQLKEILWPIF
jgi:conjugal transfer pilin signal peptidase TrbI